MAGFGVRALDGLEHDSGGLGLGNGVWMERAFLACKIPSIACCLPYSQTNSSSNQ